MSVMDEEFHDFPKTLEGFGYAFNSDGQMRKLNQDTGQVGHEPFKFNVREDAEYNQLRYDALGDVITEYVYELLEKQLGLQKLMVPKDVPEQERTFVFASPDFSTNTERLIIFIHGSGVVRAGQWSRRLIINDSLNSGTQIPFIKRALELGYAVLVLNTNDNYRVIDEEESIDIKGSRNPEDHADYVWKTYVREVNPKHIAIVAHSYGGHVTVNMANRYFSEFQDRVFAIALTDSVHNVKLHKIPNKVAEYLQKVACNWASSDSPLGTRLKNGKMSDIPRVSAGTTEHEMTSWSSFESVFKFIQDRYSFVTGLKSKL